MPLGVREEWTEAEVTEAKRLRASQYRPGSGARNVVELARMVGDLVVE